MRKWLILGSFLVAGCDEDSKPLGPFEAADEDEQALSALSDEESEALCGALESYSDRFGRNLGKASVCTYASIRLTSDAESCEGLAALCRQSPDDGEEDDDEDECGEANREGMTDCPATIAELEACINAYYTVVREDVESASCAQAGQLSGELFLTPVGVADCAPLVGQCPRLFTPGAMISPEREMGEGM